MPQQTEARNQTDAPIDTLSPVRAAEALARAQLDAVRTVVQAAPEIAAAAEAAAGALTRGNRLFYCGAGSSGLMALADAVELPGTYGIGSERIKIVLAGGAASLPELPGGYEDDFDAGMADLTDAGVSKGDCVIAVSASGKTPYTLGAAERARRAGAILVSIANNDSAPLLGMGDVAILLATPPELVAGSTRLGAGTAQKIALNSISTLVGVLLGHVHDGMMVNLRADNLKLRDRAVRTVRTVAKVDEAVAKEALAVSNGAVKQAILVAGGAESLEEATARLEKAGQNLRRAMQLESR
ncbi:N-acetylmuramic acid 6-phosphate etherase [Oricola cellulosilytica]|uniref:N-acetylmuramic acid 6-phosphate etherase n=1 Tax=Oricola cellulosilytica TaxID=1429082 RepID=A0A4R0PEQ4_9HYPH|nr:N-acetylmuramic acid 6-phosphate etherase [Oricola cellulosilytica]TCD15118.1 N-acetylmuramic acid 6-phosphate etherase [Oricola cellulosilytica]